MARWARAAGWLPPQDRRVLDVGCAFGYGTAQAAAALDRGATGRDAGKGRALVVGVEYDAAYARQAQRRYPRLAVTRGSATALPVRTASCDAVLLLDVIEHLPDPAGAVAEAARALRPGGTLIVSVPHCGLLGWADSLNLYGALCTRLPWLPPLDPTERGYPMHRHFALTELAALLGPQFRIERVARTGLGLAEPVNLWLLLICRGLLRHAAAYDALRYLYYGLYLVEDLVPAGRFGYHLMVCARRLPNPERATIAGP